MRSVTHFLRYSSLKCSKQTFTVRSAIVNSFTSSVFPSGAIEETEKKTLSFSSIRALEKLMNEELAKVKEWCDLNKLSINIKKTNYMIVKSPKKKPENTNIKLPNNDGNSDIIEKNRSY